MRDPGSVWSPLDEQGTQGKYTKNKFIVHSTGSRSSAASIFKYFNGPTENESTFIVGLDSSDPTLQILDSSEQADANLSANKSGISVEVVGTGDDEFTEWQVSELIRLGNWVHENHDIPHQIVPTPDGAGYGWHIMFGSPGPWTGVRKVCPGSKRIDQLNAVVFPAIFTGAPVSAVAPHPVPDCPHLPAWSLPFRNYYGDVHGPARSHGGYYPAEREAVKAIQRRLIAKGYVPGVSDWRSGWADGVFEQPTIDAVSRFQHAEMPGTQYYGEVWSDDYRQLDR